MSISDIAVTKSTPILLLKTKSIPHDGYEEQFSSSKDDEFDPIFVPVLEHQFIDNGLAVARQLLKRLQIGKDAGKKYGGLIFTSQRAVEVFAKLVDEGKGADATHYSISGSSDDIPVGEESWPNLQEIPIYTVGPATSRALRSIPQTPQLNIFGDEAGNGEALAHYILDHYHQWHRDCLVKPPLLFMVGEQRRAIIPKTLMDPKLDEDRRIQVDELEVYGTGVMESFEQDFTKVLQETECKQNRWVVVFSPTGCEAMLRALDMLDSATGGINRNKQSKTGGMTYIATIGPTTRDYLRQNFGYEPDVCAEKPSPQGIEDGIRKFCERNGSQ
jgi:uroporphyrinogen-III synthase